MSFRARASTTFTMGLVMALVSSVWSEADAASVEPVTAEPERYVLEHCVIEIAPPVEVGRAEGHSCFSPLHPLQRAEESRFRGEFPLIDPLTRCGWNSGWV